MKSTPVDRSFAHTTDPRVCPYLFPIVALPSLMSAILSYGITLRPDSLMSCLRNWLLLRVIWMRSTIHALDHREEILLPRRPKGTAFPA